MWANPIWGQIALIMLISSAVLTIGGTVIGYYASEAVQKEYAWRKIDQKQHDKLIAELRPLARLIGVSTIVGDSEAASYADDIAALLQESGFTVLRQSSAMSPKFGVAISQEAGEISRQLASIFNDAGILIKISQTEWGLPTPPRGVNAWDQNSPSVFIGLKPRANQ